MSFLHKKLDEKDKEKIKEDVKEIVDTFGSVLSSLSDLAEEGSIERKNSFREEKKDFHNDSSFRKKMFKNSKNKNKDFIIAEKKKW